MTPTDEQRRRSDRRKQPRGGRRPDDRPGFAPLILVADEESQSLEMCEAILAKLHFAVAPVDSVERALAILPTLKPEVIVARVRDASLLTSRADVPCVVITEEMTDPDVLAEAIRRALRGRRGH